MLDASLKKEIQTAYSQFLESRGLKARPAQKQMIAAVARTIGAIRADEKGKRLGESHLVAVEAGTGTGKTIAYLLAALPIAKRHDLKLVVSTATVALQEQLIDKDLPELAEHAGLSFRYTLAKGRGRYLCLNKAEQLLDTQESLGQMALYEDEEQLTVEPSVLEKVRLIMQRYAEGAWDGDKDKLIEAPAEETWNLLTSDHMQCSNRRCINFSVCPFYRAREQMVDADLVIANHDLVLADLSLGGGAILPEPSNTLYVFDEGHHLADKAGSHFSYSLRLLAAVRLIGGMEKKLLQFSQHCSSSFLDDLVTRTHQPIADLLLALNAWRELAESLSFDSDRGRTPRVRFTNGRQPESWMIPAKEVSHCCQRLLQYLEQLAALLKEAMEGNLADIERGQAEAFFPQLGFLLNRIQQMNWLAGSFARPDEVGKSPTARWVVLHETLQGAEYECCSSPVSVAATLQEHLWQACFGALITSATLTALGNFDRLKQTLGLPDDTPCERLMSPFDYFNAAELHIPKMRNDPGRVDEHTEEVTAFLNAELPKLSACLVLFSSWKQMFRVLEGLQSELRGRVIEQGGRSKSAMLQQHRERIDQGQPSCLFGLASFAEGVDLPGDYLTDVIITKLPFSVPDDPVDATLAEWIEQQGGNAFSDLAVPVASMRLTQAVGRLLRTEKDRGRVVILDRRLTGKFYGRQILDALPPFRQVF